LHCGFVVGEPIELSNSDLIKDIVKMIDFLEHQQLHRCLPKQKIPTEIRIQKNGQLFNQMAG
jgi:hypothetical protein